jgi:hypothetical protein
LRNGIDRGEVREQYRLALDEYRFQVDLNWRRSEYFFVLNIGVLVAGATLLASQEVPRVLVGLVFGLGVLLALLSVLANKTQGGYYRSSRDLKASIEKELDLGAMSIATTPGMGSTVTRLGRVGTFLRTMLIAIALVDALGAGLAIADAIDSQPSSGTAPQVFIRIPTQSAERARKVAVVVSEDAEAVATRVGFAGQLLKPIGLHEGDYQLWVVGPRRCVHSFVVTSKPLQAIEPSCRGAS